MSGSTENPLPIACTMGVFSAAERMRHAALVIKLHAAVLGAEALPAGRRYRFAPEAANMTMLGEFISLERLCCPFFEFTLTVEPGSRALWLGLTGPEGTREFIEEEFRGMP